MIRDTLTLNDVAYRPVLHIGAVRLMQQAAGKGYLHILDGCYHDMLDDLVAFVWAAMRWGWYVDHGSEQAAMDLPGAPGASPDWLYEALGLNDQRRFAEGYRWLVTAFRALYARDERDADAKAEGDAGNASAEATATDGTGAPSSASPTAPSASAAKTPSTP